MIVAIGIIFSACEDSSSKKSSVDSSTFIKKPISEKKADNKPAA